mgnify:CR=1 FL=1
MKFIDYVTLVAIALLVLFVVSAYLDRYQTAVEWVEDGVFSKATSWIDDVAFITYFHDPGFVSYTFAGRAMELGHYEEAIDLLTPLAEREYRDSVRMLEECKEHFR